MKNECQLSEKICSNYVEHDLPDNQRKQFEEHLKACPECQRKVLRLHVITKSLRRIPHIHTSKDFETILRARIQMTKNIGRGQWASLLDRFKAPAYVISMTAIIATIFFLHFRSANPNIQKTKTSEEILQILSNEAEIQAGDIVYSVDILTLPKESRSIRVLENKKSNVVRSMIIAKGAVASDSSANSLGFGGYIKAAGNPVSF